MNQLQKVRRYQCITFVWVFLFHLHLIGCLLVIEWNGNCTTKLPWIVHFNSSWSEVFRKISQDCWWRVEKCGLSKTSASHFNSWKPLENDRYREYLNQHEFQFHNSQATKTNQIGRWESTGLELLTIKDRHARDYVLSPVRYLKSTFCYKINIKMFVFADPWGSHHRFCCFLASTNP